MEGFAKLAGVAGELDGLLAGIDLLDGEAMKPKPGLDGSNILVGRAKLAAELVRREPLVVARGTLRVHILDQSMKSLFLAIAAPQHKMNSLQWKFLWRLPAIVGRVGQRMDCPFDSDAGAFVDGCSNPACNGDRL
jgi:hypothetical protein